MLVKVNGMRYECRKQNIKSIKIIRRKQTRFCIKNIKKARFRKKGKTSRTNITARF